MKERSGMRRYAIVFALVMGAGMLGMWTMFFATGQVPEVRTEPIRLAFHLAAEGLTALALIAAAVSLGLRKPWARSLYLVAVGMLFYTVLVSPGYFAQLGQWPFVAMFAAFGVGGLVAVYALGRGE
jgi:lipopolysaccharide export LptBFGC system permease protein LptF